jgi:hypothetical protein
MGQKRHSQGNDQPHLADGSLEAHDICYEINPNGKKEKKRRQQQQSKEMRKQPTRHENNIHRNEDDI